MTEDQKEFRLKRGNKMLEYIRRFSATEKAVFGALAVLAAVTAIAMAVMASGNFMLEVPAHGGIIREGAVGLPRTVNPVLAVTDIDKDLSALVYSGLLRYESGSLVPDIAASYTVSKDGLTYDFKLREDVYFHDGTKLSADDVEFTIQKMQDPDLKSPKRSDWVNVAVRKISPSEIQFTLKQPYSPFISNATIGILPKHVWGGVNGDQFIFSQYNTDPVGSGPYRVVSISRDAGGIPTEYRLETWASYHGKEPYIGPLIFNFFADENKALAAIDAGKIDSLAAISPAAAAKLAADSAQAYTIVSSPLPRIFGVFFNQNQVSLLADKAVRQALDVSINRNLIIDTVLNGYGTAIDGPLPHSLIADKMGGNRKSGNATSSDYLEAIAEAELNLEKNGWRRGSDGVYEKKNTKPASTTLAFDIYTADSADLKLTAELVRDAWTKLGARVTVKVFESGDLYQNVIRPRKYDVLLFGEQIGKDRDLYAFWHSSQRNAPGLNVAMYTNSKVDKILEDIRSENEPTARSSHYENLDRMIREDTPAVFLYSPDFIYAVPKKLKGISLRSIAIPSDRWNSINNWYIDTEKIWKVFANN